MSKEEVALSTAWSHQHVIDMDQAVFLQWQTLLENRIGMQLNEQRKTFLQTHLTMRMREIGCADYADYYQLVIDGPRGAIEWTMLVDRLTVQETCFFRHPDSYELVKKYLTDRARELQSSRALEMWSVGCSSGEETYSLAILAEECLASRGYQYGITGTDVSLAVLSKAKKGIYPERKLLNLTESQRIRFITAHDKHHYAVTPELKERVCFAQLNVLHLNHAPMHGMDVIYCQNMLIYFRRWRRKEIVNRLAERLAPGGLLVLGLGEVVDWQHPELERVNGNKTLAFIRRVAVDQ